MQTTSTDNDAADNNTAEDDADDNVDNVPATQTMMMMTQPQMTPL
jgi:hypothetical protein